MKIKNEKNQFDASSRILSCLLLLQYLLKKISEEHGIHITKNKHRWYILVDPPPILWQYVLFLSLYMHSGMFSLIFEIKLNHFPPKKCDVLNKTYFSSFMIVFSCFLSGQNWSFHHLHLVDFHNIIFWQLLILTIFALVELYLNSMFLLWKINFDFTFTRLIFFFSFYKISVLLWWEIKKSWKKNHVKIFHCAKDPTYTYKILTVQLKKTIRAIKLPLKTESVTAMLYVAAGWASCYSWPVSASL